MKKKEFLKNLKKKKKKNSKKNPWNNFTPRLLSFVKIATGGAKDGYSYFVQTLQNRVKNRNAVFEN
jgi:hypothetical protein